MKKQKTTEISFIRLTYENTKSKLIMCFKMINNSQNVMNFNINMTIHYRITQH